MVFLASSNYTKTLLYTILILISISSSLGMNSLGQDGQNQNLEHHPRYRQLP
jgi:hypothetical protein